MCVDSSENSRKVCTTGDMFDVRLLMAHSV